MLLLPLLAYWLARINILVSFENKNQEHKKAKYPKEFHGIHGLSRGDEDTLPAMLLVFAVSFCTAPVTGPRLKEN